MFHTSERENGNRTRFVSASRTRWRPPRGTGIMGPSKDLVLPRRSPAMADPRAASFRRTLLVTAVTVLVACRPVPSTPTAAPASARGPVGTAVVANQQSGSASVIDLASGRSVAVPVGAGPHEAAISPDGHTAVVTIYGTQVPGNGLAVIDLRSTSVVRTIDLGMFVRPHGVAFIGPDRVVITSEATRRVVLANVATGAVEADIPTEAGGSHMLGVAADARRAWTANVQSGGVSEIDLVARRYVRQIAVAPMTEGVAVTPDGREVWVGSNSLGTVSVVDTERGSVVATIAALGFPYRIGISPDGRLAAVCDPQGGRVHVVDVATRKVLGAFEGLASPRGVHIGPDSRTAMITLNGESSVAVVDLRELRLIAKAPVGASPDGVAFTPVAH